MTCREFVDFLMNYLNGELPVAQRDSFDAHMNVCPSCVLYLETYLQTIRLGKSLCEQVDKWTKATVKAAPKKDGDE